MRFSDITINSSTNNRTTLTAQQVADYYTGLLQKQGCKNQVLKLTPIPHLAYQRHSNHKLNHLQAIVESE